MKPINTSIYDFPTMVTAMDGTMRVYGKPVKSEGNLLLKPEMEIEIHRPGNSVALPKGGGPGYRGIRDLP